MEDTLSVDLDGLLSTKTVQVVESIDVDSLRQTLKWIVGKIKQQQAKPPAEELQKLLDANLELKQQVDELKQQQVDLALQQDQLLASGVPALLSVPDEVAAIQERLAAIETAAASASAPGAQGDSSGRADAGDVAADGGGSGSGDSAGSGGPGGQDSTADRLAALEAAVEELRNSLGGRSLGSGSAHGRPGDLASGDSASGLASASGIGCETARAGGSARGGAGADAGPSGASGESGAGAGAGDGGLGAGSRGASARAIERIDLGPVEDLEDVRRALGLLQTQVEAKADLRSLEQLQVQSDTLKDQLSIFQPVELQLRLESSTRDLASLSARVRDLDEDRSVGLEALEAAVAALKEAMLNKADSDKVDKLGDKLSHLSLALADKADQSALDELRLKLSLAGPMHLGSALAASATLGGGAGGGSGGGSGSGSPRGGSASAAAAGAAGAAGAGGNADGLIQLIQSMLADKAGKAEVAALREALGDKAGLGDLEALRLRLIEDGAGAGAGSGIADGAALQDMQRSFANKSDMGRLADQVGDIFAEVERLRREMSLLPQRTTDTSGKMSVGPVVKHAEAGRTDGTTSAAGALDPALLQGLQMDLQALREQVEMVAHATNILSVGLEARTAAGSGGNAVSPRHQASLAHLGGGESRSPAGAYDRLMKLLGSQGVTHKMDRFDPEVLNQLSQKMAYVDALLKNPSFGRGSGADDLGVRELDAQVRKMARDIRGMKERIANGAAPVPDGDHAMLSGKPLMGYRCMACDRPLDKLDERPGPHVPTYQMTSKMHQMKTGASKDSSRVASAEVNPTPRKKASYDPSQRGPQTWYEDGRPVPADGLPPQDVGPKLSPGGWRASSNGAARADGTRPTSPQVVAADGLARGSPLGPKSPVFELPILPRI